MRIETVRPAPRAKPPPELVGREREANQLIDLLKRPDIRLITLTGPGGIGKTRLAHHVVEHVEQAFPDGTDFVDLTAVADPSLVMETIAHGIGSKESGAGTAIEGIIATIGQQRRLLILDNFEQVLDAGPDIAILLDACRGIVVLVTSRSPLRIYGEQEFRVPPLDLPVQLSARPDQLVNSGAVQLFVNRVQAFLPDFTIDESNAITIADICRRLDGLPLAIELAAARLKAISPQDLNDRLKNRLDVLSGGPKDAHPRLQTIRSAIVWSYDLLDEPERVVFRMLSVFSGGFSLRGAEAVGHHVLSDSATSMMLDQISSLLDKSLLQEISGSDGQPRFRMLSTIREFGLEALADSGDMPVIREAHAAFFLSAVEEIMPILETTGGDEILVDLESEHDNLRLALAHFVSTGDVEHAIRLSGALAFFWFYRGHLQEGSGWYRQILALAGQVNHELDPTSMARALNGAGLLSQGLQSPTDAIAYFERALTFWDRSGNEERYGQSHLLLGGALLSRGEHDEAAPIVREELERFRRIGNRLWEASALFHLGAVDYARGDIEVAAPTLRAAVDLFEQLSGPYDAIDPLAYLGLIATQCGNIANARELLLLVLTRLQERGSQNALADGIADIAVLANKQGVREDATLLFGAAYSLRFGGGDRFPFPARVTYEANIKDLQDSLDTSAYNQFWREGSALTLEEAVQVAHRVLTASNSHQSAPEPISNDEFNLTERELDVLRLLAEGCSNAEVAERLYISVGTVRTHVANLLAKMNVKSRTEASVLAHRKQLL